MVAISSNNDLPEMGKSSQLTVYSLFICLCVGNYAAYGDNLTDAVDLCSDL